MLRYLYEALYTPKILPKSISLAVLPKNPINYTHISILTESSRLGGFAKVRLAIQRWTQGSQMPT